MSTVMTVLNLMGNSTQGPVMVSLNPNLATTGQIEEKVNVIPGVLDLDPFGGRGCANSYFDLNVLIKVGNLVLHPAAPLHIEAMICHKPPLPGEAYMNLVAQQIELLDANNRPTAIFLTGETHTPNPKKEIDYFSSSQGWINIRHPDGHIEQVLVSGPTEVQVCISDQDGLAADTDFNGLDQVPTTMTLLNLQGDSSLGPVTVGLDPNHPTTGQIEEKVNMVPGVLDLDPFGGRGCANSYFDVYPLIKIGALVLHPAESLHIEAMICHKPPRPGEGYMNLVEQAIDLLDANNRPTGYQITGEMHTPNPGACPKLEISLLPNGHVQICWPAQDSDGCALQWTRSLNPPINWQPVNAIPQLIDRKWCVILERIASMEFYRLSKPPLAQ